MRSVKVELVQIGDEKMRQKVCLTPIDKDGKLLKEKPRSWNDIKSGKFMILTDSTASGHRRSYRFRAAQTSGALSWQSGMHTLCGA